jgi:hypothetical protein
LTLPEHPDTMQHDRSPSVLDKKSAPDKKSKRKAREDKLAASLRENLLRRKSQARARRQGEAQDSEAEVKEEVDLEVKAIVPDTKAVPEADR